MDFKELVRDLKQELQEDSDLQKVASENNQINKDDFEETLKEFDIEKIASEQKDESSFQKVASELDKVETLDELVKIAEEANNTDLSALIKIADTIADKVADKIVARLSDRK